jgi:hypothetical protein
MDYRKRDLYARHVLELSNLPECCRTRSALIAGGERGVVASAYAENIVPGKEYETSPVTDAILRYFSTCLRHEDKDIAFFVSYFPSLNEFLQIYRTNIRIVYHFGQIDDQDAVQFLNAHTKMNSEDGFQIISLKN